MKKTLEQHFIAISALRKRYRDWLSERIDNLKNSTPQVALALEVSKSVLAAVDSLSDDLSYRTEMLAERQEKRQAEIDLLNANITELRIAMSNIAHKTKNKSIEGRLMKIEGRQEKILGLQDSLEKYVEQKSEQIKRQDERRRQNAEKGLPGVT
jgi:chromosome segregation ATPase